jgi:lysophospholipase L1-like esterase
MTTMTPEEIARIKEELWSDPINAEVTTLSRTYNVMTRENIASEQFLVAEGDSWFDYAPGLDILDHLKRDYNYQIRKLSEAGDTLENMVYGTKYFSSWIRETPQIVKTIDAVTRYRPKVFLFSGGGNDLAGEELDAFFNHADSNSTSLIRENYLQYVFFTVFKKAYLDLIAKIHAVDPSIHIISHGYARPIPDGRGVINFFNFRFIGPWLRPTFTKKNILDPAKREKLIGQIIDKFNDMLAELDAEVEKFHYIDLRDRINENEWVNELHLTSDAYQKVANLFHEEIQKYIPHSS